MSCPVLLGVFDASVNSILHFSLHIYFFGSFSFPDLIVSRVMLILKIYIIYWKRWKTLGQFIACNQYKMFAKFFSLYLVVPFRLSHSSNLSLLKRISVFFMLISGKLCLPFYYFSLINNSMRKRKFSFHNYPNYWAQNHLDKIESDD